MKNNVPKARMRPRSTVFMYFKRIQEVRQMARILYKIYMNRFFKNCQKFYFVSLFNVVNSLQFTFFKTSLPSASEMLTFLNPNVLQGNENM